MRKFSKLLSILLCLAMIAGMICVPVGAADSSSMTITAKTGTMGTKVITWECEDFVFQNAQANSSTAIRTSDTDHFRMYSGSQTTITAKGGKLISSIEITATASGNYATVLVTSFTNAGYTAVANGAVVTATFTTAVESVSISMSAQSRLKAVKVTFAETGGESTHTCSFSWVLEGDKHIKKCACGETEGTAAAHSGTEDFVCDVCELFIAPAADSTLTLAQAIALGEAKGHNQYTNDKYYVEGVITEVYNAQYGNMYIKDANGDVLTIYGTYSADGNTRYDALETKPGAGDTVKVYGIIGAYGTTTAVAQMKNGWIVEHTVHTCVDTDPQDNKCDLCGASMVVHQCEDLDGDFLCDDATCDAVVAPAADSTLTIPQANALGVLYASNAFSANKYYVEGVITEVYNTQYGNMYIKDAAGNTLTVYGTYSADGETRYDALETKPVAGDTIRVYGVIGQYNGKAQMKNGWIVGHTPHTCVDTDPRDHKCDICTAAMGTCADDNNDHACDYGCDKVFGTCADDDHDHACDYGCDKVFGTCADNDKDHACDYGCDKVFGTCADNDKDHGCDYGCDKVFGACVDNDKDHDCDYGCTKVFGTHANGEGTHTCAYCNQVASGCADSNGDNKCDVCGKNLGDCVDANKDHKCDKHNENMGTHAAASGKHTCDYCGKAVTECADANKDHKCDTCGETVSQCADNNNDYQCDICGAAVGTPPAPEPEPEPEPEPKPEPTPDVDVPETEIPENDKNLVEEIIKVSTSVADAADFIAEHIDEIKACAEGIADVATFVAENVEGAVDAADVAIDWILMIYVVLDYLAQY